MLYQGGEASRYAMAESLQRAERARIARDVARSKRPRRRRVPAVLIAVLTLGMKH
jgi:hypothetical protein